MITAKVFVNGNSQAIRIPREYRLEQDEVIINKIGSALVIYSRNDRLNVLMESLNEFTEDFLEHGRPNQLLENERVSLD